MWKLSVLAATLLLTPAQSAQRLSREAWGAPDVTVSNAAGRWSIEGRKTQVALNAADLAVRIERRGVRWSMAPSSSGDRTTVTVDWDAGTFTIEERDAQLSAK